MNPDYWMNLAIEEAQKAASIDEVPVGAVLIDLKTNALISKTHNVIQATKNALNHAEKLCIEQAMTIRDEKVLPDTALFVTLEPCPLCATAISFARIQECYFAAKDEKAGAIISHTQLHKNHPHFFKTQYTHLTGDHEQKSQQLLKDFFKQIRKGK